MKIVLHGKLADMFGATHEIQTIVPADAIEGLSRQLEGWPQDVVVDVVGCPTEDMLFEPTAMKELHLVPAIQGGGGNIGKIIIGAVIIAAVVFSGGTWTPLAMAILSIGISLALSGIMGLFLKAPSINKSEDPPPSKYLGADKATTAIGTYRTLAYGRNKIPGHWLSLQVDAKSLVKGRFPTTPPA